MEGVNQLSFHDAALFYASQGLAVFPLWPGKKNPLTSSGYKDATTDEAKIRAWWDRWPKANVGIATGLISGLVVLDVDPRHGGIESLEKLIADLGLVIEAPTVWTGRDDGGRHLYFAHPGGQAIRCRSNLRGYPGLDVRADGGYVVAPPSIHPETGKRYRWADAPTLASTEMLLLPAELLAVIQAAGSPGPVTYESGTWDGRLPDEVAQIVGRAPKVWRRFHRDPAGLNDPTESGIDFSLACMLARAHLTPQDIEAGIRVSRDRAGCPPKPPSYYGLTVGKALALAEKVRLDV